MSIDLQTEYNYLLEAIAKELDIPPSRYEEAVKRYNAVGKWLADGDAVSNDGEPEIYMQGSFRLGTVVRPLKDGKEADYDIDLVCRLETQKKNTTPEDVKDVIGNRLEEHGDYERMLDEEGRRCWTLIYAEKDGYGFHLDILPSLKEANDTIDVIANNGTHRPVAEKAIAITTKEVSNYSWSTSNPNGYAEWFDTRKAPSFTKVASAQRQELFASTESLYEKVEDVPDALIKTPLQRAIQLLKRHRDRRFANHAWAKDKPISIIITTLAAHMYEGETDLYTTLKNAITLLDAHASLVDHGFERMDVKVASRRLINKKPDGSWEIRNPANHGENFADRWHENNQRKARAFFQWVEWLKIDLLDILELGERSDIEDALRKVFDPNTVKKASLNTSLALFDPSTFNVAHKQAPSWTMVNNRTVTVSASVHRSREGFKVGDLPNFASKRLKKNTWLKYTATTNVAQPYRIEWQVVNTGAEALMANCARGGFWPGDNTNSRWESTLYKGTHWVEAFVVKDDVCVARSGEFVIHIK
jgi:hypothetical protein